MRAGSLLVMIQLAGCQLMFGTPDVGDGQRVCVAGTPFPTGTVVPIPGNWEVEGARFDRDKTFAYLSLYPRGQPKSESEIYASLYNEDTDTLSPVSKFGNLSAPGSYDSYPTITPENDRILLGSSRSGRVHIYVATANPTFDQPKIDLLQALSDERFSNEPYILGDGKTLLFGAARDVGPDDWDLFRAYGAPPNFGGAAAEIPGVNSGSTEFAPVETDDELEIFFATDRLRGNQALDIFTSTRSSAGATFAAPTKVNALSVDPISYPLWISRDGCELYYITKAGPDAGDASSLRVTRR